MNYSEMNWRDILNDPPSIGSQDHQTIKERSGCWSQCAIGEHLNRKGQSCLHPYDRRLTELGIQFVYAIGEGNWARGKEILNEIEML